MTKKCIVVHVEKLKIKLGGKQGSRGEINEITKFQRLGSPCHAGRQEDHDTEVDERTAS